MIERSIIIRIRDKDIDDDTAISRVMMAMKQGRISQTRHGDCYCFVTPFIDGIVVCADRTKTSDVFNVIRGQVDE